MLFLRPLIGMALAALLTATAVRAQEAPFETLAEVAILIDAKSGNVFYEKDADKLVPPASMSKLMTMIMVFDALKEGKLTLDQEFVISVDAWRRGGASSGGSTMYAEVNSRVRLEDLIKGVTVQSANDACIAIAEGMSGSEAAFSDQLTRRARQLGLQKATFRNATGLPDPEHLMSARDLATMARYIINTHPAYYEYYRIPEFTWNGITQRNRNPLLVDYPGADGMKTGYTKEAGYGLVGSAVRDGRRLVMVVSGLKSINERRQEAQKLLDWGFRQFRVIDIYAAGDRVSRARVWGGDRNWVDLVTHEPLQLALSPQEQKTMEVKLFYKGPLLAPVKAGEKVGTVKFLVEGNAVAEIDVQAADSVQQVDSMWSRALDSVMIMVFGG